MQLQLPTFFEYLIKNLFQLHPADLLNRPEDVDEHLIIGDGAVISWFGHNLSASEKLLITIDIMMKLFQLTLPSSSAISTGLSFSSSVLRPSEKMRRMNSPSTLGLNVDGTIR